MALSVRKQKFVAARVAGQSATDAAITAGYSKKTAGASGPRLDKEPAVAAAIAAGLKEFAEEMKFDAKSVLRELARIAFCDIGEAFDDEGRLKKLKDIPVNVRKAISGLEVEELFAGGGDNRIEIGQVRKLKFWEKTKGLELLGKNLKLFVEKHEHEHTGTIRLFDPYAEPKK